MPATTQHREKAKTDIDMATSFELVAATATGTLEYTAVVDDVTGSASRSAGQQRVWLLGQHIRALADELDGDISPEHTARLALDATDGEI
jgi:hypothetical protein